MTAVKEKEEIHRAAFLSEGMTQPDGTMGDPIYRYSLTRDWGEFHWERVLWIMLNPSVADDKVDDPTIKRCMGFAKSWGFSGIEVVNLFALRSTDPKALTHHINPVGPLNDTIIRASAEAAGRVVAAWGSHTFAKRRIKEVLELLPTGVQCLGKTKAGQPKHPLYVKADTERILL